MEVRYLFAVIALLLAMWLVRAQIRSNIRNSKARQSRENLRDRAADRTLVGQLFGGSRKTGLRKQQEQPANVTAPVNDVAEHTTKESSVIASVRTSAEFNTLRTRVHEKDQTILQLQQVLEELTSTTATRESVNFLQKQLIASRAKVLRQQVELKQMRVELGKRRLPAAVVPGQSSVEIGPQPSSGQRTQTNETMKARLVDQLSHAEAEAEDTQQNALELRRLRTELESVREDRSTARTHIEELQARLVEQQNALESASEQPTSADAGQSIKPLFATLEDRDDLKLIKGIGPVLERRLNALGVTTFRQLAGFTEHDIDRVSTAIAAFPGRIERDDWVGKARELLAQRMDPA